MAHCKKQCALTKDKLGFENVTYKIWVLAYDKIELGNCRSNYGADAKSTPSYFSDLNSQYSKIGLKRGVNMFHNLLENALKYEKRLKIVYARSLWPIRSSRAGQLHYNNDICRSEEIRGVTFSIRQLCSTKILTESVKSIAGHKNNNNNKIWLDSFQLYKKFPY